MPKLTSSDINNEEPSAVREADIQMIASRVWQDSELRRLLAVSWIGLEGLTRRLLDASFSWTGDTRSMECVCCVAGVSMEEPLLDL